MEIFLNNFYWMIPNLGLASLGFVLGLLYLHSKSDILRVPLFILWILFLPNTIYLITDLEHYFVQLTRTNLTETILITIQYIFLLIFGVLTYFAALVPMEKFFRKHEIKNYIFIFLIFNFAAAFAVILGKIERTHSWYIFTQPLRVYKDIMNVFMTPVLIILVIFFGILFNSIYFTFRKRFSHLK